MPSITLSPSSLSSLTSFSYRERFRNDPLLWINKRTTDTLWSKQVEIIESVRDNRRTAVPSCHSGGKSFLAARIVGWWIDSHPPGEAFVVTSAPTGHQVRAILWREMSRVHANNLPGRLNQTEWWLDNIPPDGHEEMVAFGRKPGDIEPTSFQGIHARYVLIIFDEACGMSEELGGAANTLMTSPDCRFLAIGNPDEPGSWFESVCKPGSGWNVISISAFETPAFTGERVSDKASHGLLSALWVSEIAQQYIGSQCKKCNYKWDLLGFRSVDARCPNCEQSINIDPYYISKVLAQFPSSSINSLIPLSWVREAQKRDLPIGQPNTLGVDVGGGGDKSTIAHRLGSRVRIVHRDQNPDTMETCGNVLHYLTTTGANEAKIDFIGIGRGVVDRGRELYTEGKTKKLFTGINVGERSRFPDQYIRLRSEAWWDLRERFREGDIDIDPHDEDLALQLSSIRYRRRSDNRIQVESKEEMKKRGLDSPDDADAVLLSFIEPRVKQLVSHKRESKRKGPRKRRGRR